MAQGPGSERQLPISVITGFLGAGKTTLLKRLLAEPAFRRTAVIINEFGEVPLDHELVEKAADDVIEVSSGCLCCTIRGDLSRAVRTLDLRRKRGRVMEYERIVIETTGLADPSPILQTLITDPIIAHGYRLQGVVTLVDAVNGLATLDTQPEAAKQVAVADRVLVTKTDLTGGRIPDDLRARSRSLAPGAVLLDAQATPAAAAVLEGLGPWDATTRSPDVERWLGEAAVRDARAHDHGHHHHHHHDGDDGHAHDPNRHDARIRAFCLRRPEPIAAAALALFLELLTASAGPDLLRVKGIVKLAEEPSRPLVLHAVQHLVHEPIELDAWPSADHDTRLVFIVRDIAPASITKLFDALKAA